jgi:hypothetical protein
LRIQSLLHAEFDGTRPRRCEARAAARVHELNSAIENMYAGFDLA